ncbi:hypothetical protein GWI33_022154 [Rhynchophorus ferrugineus]|uniref:Uncharacterized protein n=1 Tax=Rhynchophorus ferrugineus TaxID=354439 RepID=A0A834MHS8_RHYFE|nr:hypothetical protein GWI33_022154 [Rhynchophorus ferrugineus]
MPGPGAGGPIAEQFIKGGRANLEFYNTNRTGPDGAKAAEQRRRRPIRMVRLRPYKGFQFIVALPLFT